MDSGGGNLVMLPRDAPTDVLNELQLVQDFYGADTPADHQRVMALFAPNARLDLPQMFVAGRDNISAVMFYAKCFVADIDIEPYMVENQSAQVPSSMSRTHVYAVATITPKALSRLLTLNLLPREIHLRTRITLLWDDEAGEVLLLQERPDNLPVGLVPGALKRGLGRLLGYASTRSQWLIGRLTNTRLLAGRWPGLAQLYGTGL
ncbi:hypothetical protein OEZ86_013220 [Tetradesmus obliquus]|nr:hypothetical protein OEZ86_013220 [Tetradesmus obliquus]